VEIQGRRLWVDIRSAAGRERAHLALFWRLRPLRSDAQDSILADLEHQLGVRSVARAPYRWMNAAELRTLASSPGVDIGAHTLTHPFLASLDPDEQWREVDGSRQSLERLLQGRVTAFSYPYGGNDAFDAVTTQLVRNAGYTIACTATGGMARPGCDPLLIPRNVVGDWEADRFEQWLDYWLTAS
jgi:peptidoglycan/xylan/chitin deacetylase (PgdA/CDA1 family)